MALTSAAGFISLLQTESKDSQAYALKRLNELVDVFWAEISDHVSRIETLHEDSNFACNRLAALVASKIYYHLCEFDESLHYALCAEQLFDVNGSGEFVQTIISKCIDKYTEIRVAQFEQEHKIASSSPDAAKTCAKVDSQTFDRLKLVVNRMFEKCFEHGQHKQALGIALETRRLDIVERVILADTWQSSPSSGSGEPMSIEERLDYAFRLCLRLVHCAEFKRQVLTALVQLHHKVLPPLSGPPYKAAPALSLCQCLLFLNDAPALATLLDQLIGSDVEFHWTTVYQLAFDLRENGAQHLLNSIEEQLKLQPNYLLAFPAAPPPADDANAAPADADLATSATNISTTPLSFPLTPNSTANENSDKKEVCGKTAALAKRIKLLNSVLSGDMVIELHLQFLIRNNKTDLKLLERIKPEARHSVTHNATVLANGLMHFGTTSDQFLRENLDWLGRAVNWAKFSATASLGVIHRGHEKEALKLMSSYLPKEDGPASGGAAGGASGSASAGAAGGSMYTEGGGLYALGLIHANHGGSAMTQYLIGQCREAVAEPVRHGACLGLGLAAMGTQSEAAFEAIKQHMFQEDAVTGEAAGIGIGLVKLGSGCDATIQELVQYGRDTSHDKIVRGIAMAIALMLFGRGSAADPVIEDLARDKDPGLRWAAMASIASAYCGTGSQKAVERLLHAAVSDTSDDVRRWAVTAIGFVLFKNGSGGSAGGGVGDAEQVPQLVSLLSESYNPHVRYGAAMAVGVACAGSASREALALLEPLLDDAVPFVRQGSLIATAMCMVQHNRVTCPPHRSSVASSGSAGSAGIAASGSNSGTLHGASEFRERLLKVATDKHEDLMAKFGAILAQGILDAGGRNVTISLQTRTGNTNMSAAVGLLIFQNYWFWYPLVHFISLSFAPTAVILLNKQLKMPRLDIRSNCKPSTFAYPPASQVEKEKKKEKVETAVLSTTAKQRKKDADNKKEALSALQNASTTNATTSSSAKTTSSSGTQKEDSKSGGGASASKDKDKEKEKEKDEFSTPISIKEEEFDLLANPARVMPAQQRFLELDRNERYRPIKSLTHGGILLMHYVPANAATNALSDGSSANAGKKATTTVDSSESKRNKEQVEDDGQEEEELVEMVRAHGINDDDDNENDSNDGSAGQNAAEPDPPEPFMFVE